jgi:FAD/FMN-containing dehydrogenase
VTRTATDWDALQGAIAGQVIIPDSPDYESARRPAIARFHDRRPEAVVRCASPADVVETLTLASRSGLPTAVRGGGHSFAGQSSTAGIVIDVTPMCSVSVAGGAATVGGGALLGDVYDALLDHTVTIPAGCGPTVGIGGLTLGGGLGLLGRKHGLTCDHLVGAQVVLPDGRIIDCDAHRHEDLFWALRGAGSDRFGVVTSFVFDTVPEPQATSFHLTWPHTHAAAVVRAWQTWGPVAPEELAASVLVTAARDPERPPVVHAFGSMLGSESDTANLLSELVVRAGVEPDSAAHRHGGYRETKRYLAEHGPGEEQPGGHPFSKSEFFRQPLPAEAISALADGLARGRVPGASRELDFTPWGGAYNRVPTDATAFAHREEFFLLKQAVVVDPGVSVAAREAERRWLERSWALVHPWGSGGVYPNFPDPDLEDPERAYHGPNLERLLRVERRY